MPPNTVPVLVISYRRQEHTSALLNRLPGDRRVYILSDGIRCADHAIEVAKTRAAIQEYCSVNNNAVFRFRDSNRGGPDGIPEAIDWALSQESAICVLEEDCIPSSLAWNYIDRIAPSLSLSSRIAGATLNNFVSGRLGKIYKSPMLSLYNHCWGWATSKQSWRILRPNRAQYSMASPNYLRLELEAVLNSRFRSDSGARQYWRRIFNQILLGKIYHWDYAYMLNMLRLGLFMITPPANLASNTGAGGASLNCKEATKNHFLPVAEDGSKEASLALQNAIDPVYSYEDFDRLNQRIAFGPPKLRHRITDLLRKV